jgi:hypothetical protein
MRRLLTELLEVRCVLSGTASISGMIYEDRRHHRRSRVVARLGGNV